MRQREVRASYDPSTIVVYQAYAATIADAAAAHGRFAPSYNRGRMTWIKPSFLWMMYRCGWASKPGQERVLAVRLRREGFEWALRHSALSHYDPRVHADEATWRESLRAPVRIQWDPERGLLLAALPYRTIQVGLSGEAVDCYLDEWITGIEDVTDLAYEIHRLVVAGAMAEGRGLLPAERAYPLPPEVAAAIGATTADDP